MEGTEQYFHVFDAIQSSLNFLFVGDHASKTYRAAVLCGSDTCMLLVMFWKKKPRCVKFS